MKAVLISPFLICKEIVKYTFRGSSQLNGAVAWNLGQKKGSINTWYRTHLTILMNTPRCVNETILPSSNTLQWTHIKIHFIFFIRSTRETTEVSLLTLLDNIFHVFISYQCLKIYFNHFLSTWKQCYKLLPFGSLAVN